jgi:hypothetical protein
VILTTLGFEKRVFIEDMVLNGFKLGDAQITLFWPSTPGEITQTNVEQVIKVLSLIRVRVSMKIVKSRPDLHLHLLHPVEAHGLLGFSGVEPPKVANIPTAEYFAEETLD